MNTGMITRRGGLLAACGAVVLLVGCGGSDEPSAQPTSSAPATSATASPSASGTVVTVTETEYALQLSQDTFTPGTYTFVAENAGNTTHALEIEGPGIEEQETDTLSPGDSGQLTVDLQAGTYELYCPVGGHRGLGMETEITVAG
ncbi:MAG: plastocyanin/azurin family copper-binding protein [Actinomycetes bacterium]